MTTSIQLNQNDRPWRDDPNLSTEERVRKYDEYIAVALEQGKQAAENYVQSLDDANVDGIYQWIVFDGRVMIRISRNAEEAFKGINSCGPPVDAFHYVNEIRNVRNKPSKDRFSDLDVAVCLLIFSKICHNVSYNDILSCLRETGRIFDAEVLSKLLKRKILVTKIGDDNILRLQFPGNQTMQDGIEKFLESL